MVVVGSKECLNSDSLDINDVGRLRLWTRLKYIDSKSLGKLKNGPLRNSSRN
jgi:hypothetical protein